MVNVVNMTVSRIIQKTNVWTCLWGSIQTKFTQMGRPTLNVDSTMPLAGAWTEKLSNSIHLCFLTGCNDISRRILCRCGLLIMNCALKPWAKMDLSFPTCVTVLSLPGEISSYSWSLYINQVKCWRHFMIRGGKRMRHLKFEEERLWLGSFIHRLILFYACITLNRDSKLLDDLALTIA